MAIPSRIPLIKVRQWMESWDLSDWCKDGNNPPKEFYVGSISIALLRQLAGVGHRTIEDRLEGGEGVGYQRAHSYGRSKKIARYMRYGYPLSSQSGLDVEEHSQLIHPGWLPTSILVNVIPEGEERRRAGKKVSLSTGQTLSIESNDGMDFLVIPELYRGDAQVKHGLEPVEVIDGQHRLYAVDHVKFGSDEDYEVPVVFFDGMALDQQAYLFWVINVEPKKINASLAFDLYPELRSKSWLEGVEGIKVYQEHRAQELTEVLWRHPLSPWRGRVELHGARVQGHVSNAAIIRSLVASFVRRWGAENRIGGFFGSVDGGYVIPWNRSQQAAYLITCWHHVHAAALATSAEWARRLRDAAEAAQSSLEFDSDDNEYRKNAPFSGAHSLLATDQGCRAVLVIYNAMSQAAYEVLELDSWDCGDAADEPDDASVAEAVEDFKRLTEANDFLRAIADELINGFDWRTSSAPGLDSDEKLRQGAYRGSSGYRALSKECLNVLSASIDPLVAKSANTAHALLME